MAASDGRSRRRLPRLPVKRRAGDQRPRQGKHDQKKDTSSCSQHLTYHPSAARTPRRPHSWHQRSHRSKQGAKSAYGSISADPRPPFILILPNQLLSCNLHIAIRILNPNRYEVPSTLEDTCADLEPLFPAVEHAVLRSQNLKPAEVNGIPR